MNPKFAHYAHPEALVDGDWLQAHLTDPDIRIVESNEDVLLYDTGHIPGAVHIDWRGDLQDNTVRDYVTPEGFCRGLLQERHHARTPPSSSTATNPTGGRPTPCGPSVSSVTPG